MKTLPALCALLIAAAAPAAGEVEIRLSIKIVLGPGDVWPSNANTIGPAGSALNLNSEAVLRSNIQFTNDILSSHGTCYRLVLRNDTIYTLSGFPATWFNGDPRTTQFREALEDAATMNAASRAVWQWHDDSVNIYLNNSRPDTTRAPAPARFPATAAPSPLAPVPTIPSSCTNWGTSSASATRTRRKTTAKPTPPWTTD